MTDDLFISYAQTMEDVMLWRALRHEAPGFYIDAGAADPDRLSVTRAFYERGWRGLDIEPLPEQAARLRAARPRDIVVEAALADRAGAAEFYRVRVKDDLGLSTLDRDLAARAGGQTETLTVPLTTLAALCREHVPGDVHFLKIDVEGAEAAVLRGMDFTQVRPWIVLVEAVEPGTGKASGEAIEPILHGAGYVGVWFDGLNRFYVAQEHHAALAGHFKIPPNPFDHYKVADLPREALLNARLELIEALEAELARSRSPAPASISPPGPKKRPRAALFAWRLVRPVLRPLAWRLRTFLVGDLQARQDLIVQRLDALLAQRTGPALDASLADAAERLLLTLALEREL